MGEYIRYNGSRIKDLRGQIFGDFKAVEIVGIKNKYAQWECECTKCGKMQEISAKYLLRGNKKCDCGKPAPAPPKIPKDSICDLDISEMDFGFWHVKEKSEKKNGTTMYTCECRCGTIKDISVYHLVNGLSASCGCSKKEDVTGKEFGFLKAVKPVGSESGEGIVWECECRCGNKVNVTVSDLGWHKSCGCMGDIEKEQHTKIVWAEKGGRKLRSNNTSGISGVNLDRGKWVARITFKKKSYHLGRYYKKEDAKQARKTAEKHLYADFLEWYNKTFAEQQQKERLQEKLEKLTEKQREIYSLYLSSKKRNAIAKELGFSRQHISETIKSAEKRIARLEEKELKQKEKKKRKPYNRAQITTGTIGKPHEDLSKYAQMDMSILSEKQQRVLQYRLDGKTNKEIAEFENISLAAVSGVISAIKVKTGDNKDCKIKSIKVDTNIDKIGNSYAVFTTYEGKTVYLATVKNLEEAREIRNTADVKKEQGVFLEWKNSLLRIRKR